MNIEFNLNNVRTFMKDFYDITHLRSALYDADFQVLLTYPSLGCDLRNLIAQTPEGRLRCHQSDNLGLLETRNAQKVHTYICHAGLTELCFPIKYNLKIVGYLIFGQLLDEHKSSQQNVAQCCHDLIDDENTWLNAIKNLSPMHIDYILSCSHIMEACIQSVLLDTMLKISQNSLWQKIDAWITANIDKKILLSDLSRELMVSESTISHKAKEMVGQSMGEFILRRKMSKACEYLLVTDLKIHEVAVKVGIPDYNYFSRAFKKVYGLSPYQYRKSAQISQTANCRSTAVKNS